MKSATDFYIGTDITEKSLDAARTCTVLKNALVDEDRVKQPLLDEQEIAEIELLILEAMKFNTLLTFKVFNNGFTRLIKDLRTTLII